MDEFNKDYKEIFDYKEPPKVSLPQFVIDRVEPCVKAFENGLKFNGAIKLINGIAEDGTKLEDDPYFQDNGPIGLPKLTPEFISWRDNWRLENLRQMKIVIALIYSYEVED